MKNMRFLAALGMTVGILFTLYAPAVFAQQVDLALSPPVVEATIKPGRSILVAYQLENFGDPTAVKVTVLPFIPRDNLGNVALKEQFDPDSIGVEGPIQFALDNSDIVLNQPFFLRTKQSQQILLRMQVPQSTSAADYYYTLLVETQANPAVEGASASRAQARIGSNILMTVTDSGQVDIQGAITLFDVLSRFKSLHLFDSSDKIPVVLIAQNKGANLIKPDGEITLAGSFGEVAKYKILPQNILANSQRLLLATPSASFDCPSQSRAPQCLRPISVLLSGFFVGRYKLSTNLNFGATTVTSASTTFFAFPFKFLAAVVAVIVVGILILRRVRK